MYSKFDTKISRRRFLQSCMIGGPAIFLVGAKTVSAQEGSNFPSRAVTDFDNDPFIIGIEKQLGCTCGCTLDVYTCRTTDFTCATSPAMHQQVISLVQEGMSEQEVLDTFVAQHGETVLMAPPPEGFNLVGYYLPGAAILTGGAALLWTLRRRFTLAATAPVADQNAETAATPPTAITEADQALLESELANLGS